MKRISSILLGLWCGFVSFITPVWIVMTFLNISGLIYQYDSTMDDGTAIIIGIVSLMMWVVLGLIPNIYMGRKLYFIKKNYLAAHLTCVMILGVICQAMCDWNIIGLFG